MNNSGSSKGEIQDIPKEDDDILSLIKWKEYCAAIQGI